DAAEGWAGAGGRALRMRNRRARGKNNGARAGAETLRALRFRKLCDGSGGRADLDYTARTVAETGQVAGTGVCARLSGDGKGIVPERSFGRGKNAPGGGGAEGIDPPRAQWRVLRLSRTVERDSGKLQSGERIHRNGRAGTDSRRGNSGARRPGSEQAFGLGAG